MTEQICPECATLSTVAQDLAEADQEYTRLTEQPGVQPPAALRQRRQDLKLAVQRRQACHFDHDTLFVPDLGEETLETAASQPVDENSVVEQHWAALKAEHEPEPEPEAGTVQQQVEAVRTADGNALGFAANIEVPGLPPAEEAAAPPTPSPDAPEAPSEHGGESETPG